MNLKTFAQKSRNILMEGVAQKVLYWGFDAKGNVVEEPTPVGGGYLFRGSIYDDPTGLKLWQALRNAIKKKGVKEVVEEAAYTWFNRIMAIRILSANKYEPPQLDYTSSEVAMPQMLQRARRGQYEYLSDKEKKRLQAIITDYSQDNQSFAILLVGYCHAHPLLQSVFGGINDYTELLLPENILATNGFVHLLNTTDAITEEECQKVELIGWLYQFYISDRKDEVFAGFKQNKKAEAKDIPAATQIFTPNWIVKYMVENTVGKLWLDLHPDSPIKQRMKYLVESTNPEYGNPIISQVEQLKLLDPAVGSGHILVEGFDLLYEMYIEDFASPEEAVESILKNNLFGLDIDKRAVQLARFAVLLKAAKKNRNILKKGMLPHIYAMPEPYTFSRQEVLDFLGEAGRIYEEPLIKALKLMEDAQNFGSIMQFELNDEIKSFIIKRTNELETKKFKSFSEEVVLPNILPYIKVIELLTSKYEAVAANPPYMGQKSMNAELKNYVNKKYPVSKADLFAVFMEVCLTLIAENGLMSMINQHSWMFLSSYEELREKLLSTYTISHMLHLGPRTFEEISGEVVQSTAFVILKSKISKPACYFRLVNFKTNQEKEKQFILRNNQFDNIFQDDFSIISGKPIAYWINAKVHQIFSNSTLESISELQGGITTGNDDTFLKNWYEVSANNIGFDSEDERDLFEKKTKWFPLNKTVGSYRWSGLYQFVINFKNRGEDLVKQKGKINFRLKEQRFYFKPGITWSDVGSNKPAFRFQSKGILFAARGPMIFSTSKYILGILNSKVVEFILNITSPTLTFNLNEVKAIPIILSENLNQRIEDLVTSNINLSTNYFNNKELSWDYDKSPLLNNSPSLIKAYESWESKIIKEFYQLHTNEEEINQIAISIYDLKDVLSSTVLLSDITILEDEIDHKALNVSETNFREKGKAVVSLPIKRNVVMEQFISYAIGVCMGRYRLDKPGLNIAFSNPKTEDSSPYTYNGYTLQIDEDGIIPLMGRACQFADDAYQRLLHLLQAIWGADTLTQNLNFMQECLNQDLEKYLVKNFWKDHVQMYKKKPIYWLFTSSKGAFQVLVYMHRMNRFTVEKIRSNYLIEHLKHLRFQISQLENRVAILNRDEARLLDKLRVDLLECEAYDMLLKNKADQQIEFDLDNGVTVNYELFKGVVAPIK